MFIYKITNLTSKKIYVGKTTKTIQQRWKRHVNDAMSNRLSTALACAIRKYGAHDFTIEEIDSAKSEQELNYKEKYWIEYYNSTDRNIGYNLCPGGEGGNTYSCKSETEMIAIKAKISKSKIGQNNPNSLAVKCKNIDTQAEYHFNTLQDMQIFFNETQHNFITRRCLHKTKCLYKKEWLIAYESEEYDYECTKEKHNHRARSLVVQNREQQKEFRTFTEAEKYFNFHKGLISKLFNKHGNVFSIDDKTITVIV